tara:strand:- start:11733 stop:14819 length:3087 start_codon:yes stop_codon:yes gene_type:complete
MSFGATKLLSASGSKDAYEIDQSLVLNKADGAYLERTPSSASSRRTWTFSAWIKKSTSSDSAYVIFSAHDNSNENDAGYGWIGFYGAKLYFGGGSTNWRITNRKFRDVGAWMHLVVAVDTTDGTAGDRVKIYINGVEETAFQTTNNPDQNEDLAINSTVEHQIGAINYSNRNYFDGYMAEVNFIDGSQLTPSSFGKTDSETNAWIPKKYGGAYGTNGFYLPFAKNARYCVYFDGSTSTGIEIADNADFDVGSGNFTIEAWIYVDEDAGNTRYISGQSSSSGANSSGAVQFQIASNNKLTSYIFDASDTDNYLTLEPSSATISDNKWHHVAIVRNGTAFNLYQDGTSIANVTSSITVNNSTAKFAVGCLGEYTAGHFKGWISNYRFVKGTAVYTSNFTPATSPLTAITNTKLLCCQDSTVTTDNSGTSKTLTVTAANTYSQQMSPFTYDWYQDQSGQDNHYQADNVTINDVMLDTPTNNFCTWNSLDNGSTVLSQGNLKFVNSSGNSDTGNTFAIPHTGKWYFEHRLTVVDAYYAGFLSRGYTATAGSYSGFTAYQIAYDGRWYNGSDFESYASSFSNGDILGWAIDCDNGKVYVSVNGTFANSGNPVNGTNPADTFTATADWKFITYGNSGSQFDANFGQNGTFNGLVTAQGNADGGGIGNFYYSPPSGFKAFCSKNLPDPAVKKSTDHFNTVLWSGNETEDRAITGVGFAPDWVWLKSRSNTYYHQLHDSVRGTSGGVLYSNTHDAESSTYSLASFDSDGFTVMKDANNDAQNDNGQNYVAWNWKANGSGGANTDGATNSVVSANTTSGFSIVTYSGTGSATTIGHGLGVVPAWIVVKNRTNNAGNTDAWANYHHANTGEPATDALYWDTTYGTTDDAGTWNDTAPTSSVFTVNNWGGVNASGDTYVAYVFAEVEGFSKFGVYEANNSTNGPFIHTGFTPSWIIFKYIDGNGEWWWMLDSTRDPINPTTEVLYINATSAESSIGGSGAIDILSNGFKIRATNGGINTANTYVYMAFAEFPFKYANAR